MTREEILEHADLSVLEFLHIDPDTIPDEVLYTMAMPYSQLSDADRDMIYQFLRSHSRVPK